jgi:hypothetical protein
MPDRPLALPCRAASDRAIELNAMSRQLFIARLEQRESGMGKDMDLNEVRSRIIELGADDLETLEVNARRIAASMTGTYKANAGSRLPAIEKERSSRADAEVDRCRGAAGTTNDGIQNHDLFERALLAFEKIPPANWEIAVLRAVADHPDRDLNYLSGIVDAKDGGYISLALGKICGSREEYLGKPRQPQAWTDRDPRSTLLIDYRRHEEPDGTVWHGLVLKPEAEAALRRLNIVGHDASPA